MDPSAAAWLPYPEVPAAPGRHERTPRDAATPAPARQSHRLITFASGPRRRGAASHVALRSPKPRGVNSLPMTSSSEMQRSVTDR